MKDTTVTKTEAQLKQAELEKLSILAKADEIKGELLLVNEDGIFTENQLRKFALGEVDDPEKKHDIYYQGITKLLKRFLPQGEEYSQARNFIYEEKNTLLTRGKRVDKKGIRGADSRMAYTSDMEELLNIITAWIISKGTMIELFNTLRNLNISKGYGVPK